MTESPSLIGIKAIGYATGDIAIDNLNRAADFDSSSEFVETKIGFRQLLRCAPGTQTVDLAHRAVENLVQRTSIDLDTVDVLVIVTQNPDYGGIPHTSARLHAQLGLQPHCSVFDVGLGCSGFVHALAITKSFMEAQGLGIGLLVTADPYSRILNDEDRATELIFGDAAAATLLTTSPRWRVGPFDLGTESNRARALRVDGDHLTMDGRAVFDFAAKRVPGSILAVLDQAGLSLDDVDAVLAHQGSRFIVETIRARLGPAVDVPFEAAEYGNTVSSSIPLMLADRSSIEPERLIVSGFGVGLAWATALLEEVRTHGLD